MTFFYRIFLLMLFCFFFFVLFQVCARLLKAVEVVNPHELLGLQPARLAPFLRDIISHLFLLPFFTSFYREPAFLARLFFSFAC